MTQPQPSSPRTSLKVRLRRYLTLALIPFGFTTLAALSLDLYGQRAPTEGRWDAIVVAGCRVRPSGAPSVPLRRRTELAVELWQRGYAPVVVFTGGLGEHPPAESVAASEYARSLGLPEEAVVVEAASTSTEENAAQVAAMGQYRRVLVVTDSFHRLRAGRVFGRYFEEVGTAGAVSPPLFRLRGALREVTAIGYYALTLRL